MHKASTIMFFIFKKIFDFFLFYIAFKNVIHEVVITTCCVIAQRHPLCGHRLRRSIFCNRKENTVHTLSEQTMRQLE
jgi:hypothetical protein